MDGMNLYTTVLMDGSTSGDPSAGCNYPTATHTPEAYNMLNSTGGWVYGTAGYMTSYITVQNDQQVAVVLGGNYTWTTEGEVVCSVFGDFYDVYYPGMDISVVVTFGKNTGSVTNGAPPKNKYCTWLPACSSLPKGQLGPTCGASGWQSANPILNTDACSPYIEEFWGTQVVSGPNGSVRICVGTPFPDTGPGPCT
jgi:hypothetical protein